jgi:hypothetical protein
MTHAFNALPQVQAVQQFNTFAMCMRGAALLAGSL